MNNPTSRRAAFSLLAIAFLAQHADCRLRHTTTVDNNDGHEAHDMNNDRQQNEKIERKLPAKDKWYVDWDNGRCVQDCNVNSNNPSCGGSLNSQRRQNEFLLESAQDCCEFFEWPSFDKCMDNIPGFDSITDSMTLNSKIMKKSNVNKNRPNKNRKRKTANNKKKKNNNNDRMGNTMKQNSNTSPRNGILNLEPINDAYVDGRNPGETYNSNTLQYYGDIVALIQFKVPAGLGSDTNNNQDELKKATLSIMPLEDCKGNMNIEAVTGRENWNEQNVNYKNAPNRTGPQNTEPRVSLNQNQLRKNKWLDVEVTKAVLWTTQGEDDGLVTFRISGDYDDNSKDGCIFASKEYNKGNFAPSLELRFGDDEDEDEPSRMKEKYEPLSSKNEKKKKKKPKKNQYAKQGPKKQNNPMKQNSASLASNFANNRPQSKPLPQAQDGILLQQENDSCDISRFIRGVDECTPGLACYRPDQSTTGFGVCSRICQMERYLYGQNECDPSHVCYTSSGATSGPGVCTVIDAFAMNGMPCDATFGRDACDSATHRCVVGGGANNGVELFRVGTGVCGTPSSNSQQVSQQVGGLTSFSTTVEPTSVMFAGENQVCDSAVFGANACAAGFVCQVGSSNGVNGAYGPNNGAGMVANSAYGTNGAQGATGAYGTNGAQGATGAYGTNGAAGNGAYGTNGAAGNGVHGSGAGTNWAANGVHGSGAGTNWAANGVNGAGTGINWAANGAYAGNNDIYWATNNGPANGAANGAHGANNGAHGGNNGAAYTHGAQAAHNDIFWATNNSGGNVVTRAVTIGGTNGANGSQLGGVGTGICVRNTPPVRSPPPMQAFNSPAHPANGWYVDYTSNQCMGSCEQGAGPHCAGLANSWDQKFSSPELCCSSKLWWKAANDCSPALGTQNGNDGLGTNQNGYGNNPQGTWSPQGSGGNQNGYGYGNQQGYGYP